MMMLFSRLQLGAVGLTAFGGGEVSCQDWPLHVCNKYKCFLQI